MSLNKNIKIYLSLGLCFIIILALWFYSFKLNLTYGLKNNQVKNGLSLKNLRDEVKNILRNSPLVKGENNWPTLKQPNATATPEDWQKIAGEMTETIKGLNTANSTSTPTTTNNSLR